MKRGLTLRGVTCPHSSDCSSPSISLGLGCTISGLGFWFSGELAAERETASARERARDSERERKSERQRAREKEREAASARDSERERKFERAQRTREAASSAGRMLACARMHTGRCLAQVHETLHAGNAFQARRIGAISSSPQHTVGDKRAHHSAGQCSSECRSRCTRRVRGRQALERRRA